MSKQKFSTFKIVFVGMMAAVVCVVTLFRIPLLGTKVHFANAMCLLSGLLFGPVYGGLAAGFGSGLYDMLLGGYPIDEVLVTFVSKFIMAWLCAKIAYGGDAKAENHARNIFACVIGALSYVALYMLKQLVYKRFIAGMELEATYAVMLSKLPGSLINAAAAMIVAPTLFAGLSASLRKTGILAKLKD
ncbi:MAG: ECF transporter S component [Clostridia bacterium]|nr:ECF transporter S component [Clostridia bacterium]